MTFGEAVDWLVANPGREVRILSHFGPEKLRVNKTTRTLEQRIGSKNWGETTTIRERLKFKYEIVEEEPSSLEQAIKAFGCHEQQVRELLKHLQVKETK